MDLHVTNSKNESFAIPIELRNENLVRREITKNDHPHSLLILGIVIVVVVVLYMLYINAIKQSISGLWVADTLKKIKHNKWNDTFTVDNKIVGTVSGNALFIKGMKTQLGVIDGNKIYWVGGEVWQRPIRAL